MSMGYYKGKDNFGSLFATFHFSTIKKASKLRTKSLQSPIHSNFFRELQFTDATQGGLELATLCLGIPSF